MSSAMLVNEPRDQSSLQQECRKDRHDLQTILFPDTWFPKENLASWGQAAFADPPPLQFSPVILRRSKLADWSFDVAGLLAPENADSDRSGSPANLGHRLHWPSQQEAKEGVIVGEYRRVCDVMNACEGRASFVPETCPIDRQQMPENCRLRRQRGCRFKNLFKRQIVCIEQLYPAF